MRKEMIKAETEQEARDAAPWACEIAECEGGFWAFESADDARTWHAQVGDDEVNTLDETPCGEGIGWWRDPSLPAGAVAHRWRTDITCADHGCAICAPHRAQVGDEGDDRKTIGEIAEAWAKTDAAEWSDGAGRILRAVRARTSDDGGILDAAYDALLDAGYAYDEIVEGDLCEELAEEFLSRIAGGAQ